MRALMAKPAAAAETWRSSLYPPDWSPGFTDDQGRFLHDFSYAGYHFGQDPIPTVLGPMFNVRLYGADGDDQQDDTQAIQQAINEAQQAGGGVVYLPAGTYYVTPTIYGTQGGRYQGHPWALLITGSRVVLRGDGPDRTRIFYNSTFSHRGGILMVSPRPGRPEVTPGSWDEVVAFDLNRSDWREPVGDPIPLAADLITPTKVIPLQTTAGLEVGDWIVIRGYKTEAFLSDHHGNVNGYGLQYYRQILAIDRHANTITVDIPTRYPLKRSYDSQVYKVKPALEEVGIEDLSFAMLESPNLEDISTSYVLYFKNARHSWVRNVSTYPPPQNSGGYGYPSGAPDELKYHIHSYGLELRDTRNITVDNAHFANPQHHGGGGNGYLFIIQGSDNLIQNSSAANGRHNFSFKGMVASGNVLYANTSRFTPNYPRVRNGEEVNGMTLESDFHMWLSHANLIDNFTLDGDSFLAQYRPCCSHYIAAAQNVFWNTNVVRSHILGGPAVVSDQWGWGYVIGMRGPQRSNLLSLSGLANPGDPNRPDFFEPPSLLSGQGMGESLEPQSLYLDQLRRRLQLWASFQDVPPDHPYFPYIEALYRAGYVKGCSESPPLYCPERAMNRAESAVFTVRGVHGAEFTPPQPSEQIFGDVALDAWYADWVTQLWEDGYTAGCSSEPLLYCPERTHTRAEGAVFFLRMMYGADYQPPPAKGYFVDVPLDTWYARWVDAAWEAGIAEACAENPLRYCPEEPLSRAVAAYMMAHAKGLTIDPR
jgi:hypothetical protein